MNMVVKKMLSLRGPTFKKYIKMSACDWKYNKPNSQMLGNGTLISSFCSKMMFLWTRPDYVNLFTTTVPYCSLCMYNEIVLRSIYFGCYKKEILLSGRVFSSNFRVKMQIKWPELLKWKFLLLELSLLQFGSLILDKGL